MKLVIIKTNAKHVPLWLRLVLTCRNLLMCIFIRKNAAMFDADVNADADIGINANMLHLWMQMQKIVSGEQTVSPEIVKCHVRYTKLN